MVYVPKCTVSHSTLFNSALPALQQGDSGPSADPELGGTNLPAAVAPESVKEDGGSTDASICNPSPPRDDPGTRNPAAAHNPDPAASPQAAANAAMLALPESSQTLSPALSRSASLSVLPATPNSSTHNSRVGQSLCPLSTHFSLDTQNEIA